MLEAVALSRNGVGHLCPLCSSPDRSAVITQHGIPVFANVLYDSRDGALAAPTGTLDLVACLRCGLLYNQAVDMSLLEYSAAYENSLHHSAVFQKYASSLAARLVDTYELKGRDVVEIGPGNGDFMTMMVRAGASKGIGFDPSHEPTRAVLTPGVTIHAEAYPSVLPRNAAAVTCRHVIEHLDAPAQLLDAIRSSLGDTGRVVVYLEVPDATYMVENVALWDLIYEHVTYCREETLNWACERAGLKVLNSGRSFADQYLWNESTRGVAQLGLDPPDPADFVHSAVEFGAETLRRIERWGQLLSGLASAGPLAVWGAGSKGTSFLSLVPGAAAVEVVVDVNPAKSGRFVPVGGQLIVAPDALVGLNVANVIVMNPIYRDEIVRQLADLGLDPAVHTV